MTVDLSKLSVGDTIVLRDGSKHVVSEVDPSMSGYLVTTTTKRIGRRDTSSPYWRHVPCGKWVSSKVKVAGDIMEIIKKEKPVSKFKTGDRVFHVGFGVGEVINTNHIVNYPIKVEFITGISNVFTSEGFWEVGHVIPQLLTLEEARAKGYDVPS